MRTAEQINAAADEIERLRAAVAELLFVVEPSCNTDYDASHIKRLRALLPPPRLDDARERFEESMRPIERAPTPAPEAVAEWGRNFEASAVRMPSRVCATCGQYPGLCGHPLPPS